MKILIYEARGPRSVCPVSCEDKCGTQSQSDDHHRVISNSQALGELAVALGIGVKGSVAISLDYWEPRASDTINVHTCVTYRIKVSLPALGKLKSDLSNSQPIRILSPRREEPQSLQASDKKEVSALGLFGKGHCTLTASLATNLIQQKGEAAVHCTIENNSKHRVMQVRTELIQIVEFLPTEWSRRKTRTINCAQ